jgi:hypothetical protein
MKQTELRRKTPLRSRKGLRPGLSPAKKNKAERKPGKQANRNRSGKSVKKKCDSRWSKIIRSIGRCEVCGRSDLPLEAHHLIHRNALAFRYDLRNGVCLCPKHHTGNYGQHEGDIALPSGLQGYAIEPRPEAISAHGTPWAFEEWLKDHKPEQYEWFEKNRHKVFPGVKIDYRTVYQTLKERANG